MGSDKRAVLYELLYSGLITIRLATPSGQRPLSDPRSPTPSMA